VRCPFLFIGPRLIDPILFSNFESTVLFGFYYRAIISDGNLNNTCESVSS
jgi:hypothetical protein